MPVLPIDSRFQSGGEDLTPEAARWLLREGRWEDAAAVAEVALTRHSTPETRLVLAAALWCGYRVMPALDQLKTAYREYAAGGQPARAAWVAGWVACEEAATRGNLAVARGWFRRASRLLEGCPDCSERGWLMVWRAAFEGDVGRLLEAAEAAAALARRHHDADLEILCCAQRGLALVMCGQVDEGMACLDEAMAAVTAGDVSSPVVIGDCFCAVFSACEQACDYPRAEEWCRVALETAETRSIGFLKANCLASYGWILGVLGRWQESEARLRQALEMFASGHRQLRPEVLVKLADLRRRQGRLSEARRLLEEAPDSASRQRVEVELALDSGDFQRALEGSRVLVGQLEGGPVPAWAVALQLRVRAAAACGALDEAGTALELLEATAAAADTAPMLASLWLARGIYLQASGSLAAAAAALSRSSASFQASGAVFDAAQAQLRLGGCLRLCGQTRESELAFQEARRIFDQLGRGSAATSSTALSRREVDVLRLLAAGLSNQAIASRLGLSPHTVHRHVAGVLRKLNVATRAAAAAEAARLGMA